jgi:OmpA-OmpF porin, OOP family
MKKIYIIALVLAALTHAYAQTAEKKWGVGIYAGTYRYYGDLGTNFNNLKHAHPTVALSLNHYLTKTFDFSLFGSAGMLDYNNDSTHLGFDGKLVNLTALLRFKFNNGWLIKENAFIAPFVQAGFGDALYINKTIYPKNRPTDFNFPVGGGIRFRLGNNASFIAQSTYHFTLTDNYDGRLANAMDAFLHHSIGFIFNFDKKDDDKDAIANRLDKCPGTPEKVKVDAQGCPIDTDKDGIADYLDQCPTVAGVATGKGCPDKDGDAIVDAEDACQDVAGLANLNGCPDKDGDGVIDSKDNCPSLAGKTTLNGCPDKDDDGIMDSEDKCPTQKGTAPNNGCPDADNDGVIDSQDKCPSLAGTLANNGCPEISEETKKVFEQALTGIQFESGKDVIKKTSFAILDNVVLVMKNNPSYLLTINGHTDNQGDAKKNLDLSQRRSDAVKKYIATHGITENRMTAKGYGSTTPIEENKTPQGRAKNRRVEFKVEF